MVRLWTKVICDKGHMVCQKGLLLLRWMEESPGYQETNKEKLPLQWPTGREAVLIPAWEGLILQVEQCLFVCLFVYLIYSSRGLVTSGGTWARDGLFDINSQVDVEVRYLF